MTDPRGDVAPSAHSAAVAALTVEFDQSDARPQEVFYYAVTLAALATGAGVAGREATVFLWSAKRKPEPGPDARALYDLEFRACGAARREGGRALAGWLVGRVRDGEASTGIRLVSYHPQEDEGPGGSHMPLLLK